jgi:hypothetical protein
MSSLNIYVEQKIVEILKIIFTKDFIKAHNMLSKEQRNDLKNLIIKMYNDAFDEGEASIEIPDPETDKD